MEAVGPGAFCLENETGAQESGLWRRALPGGGFSFGGLSNQLHQATRGEVVTVCQFDNTGIPSLWVILEAIFQQLSAPLGFNALLGLLFQSLSC